MGRQETGVAVQPVAVSPHVKSPSDPVGSGVHSAAAPPGWSLSPWMGVTQPREKAEGRRAQARSPRAASSPPSRLPDDRRRPPQAQAPATQQTPFACPAGPRAAPRPRPKRAVGGGEPSCRAAPGSASRRRRRQRQRRCSDTKPVLRASARPRSTSSPPRAPASGRGLRRTLATPPKLP